MVQICRSQLLCAFVRFHYIRGAGSVGFLWGNPSDVVLEGEESPPAGTVGQQKEGFDYEQLPTDDVLEGIGF